MNKYIKAIFFAVLLGFSSCSDDFLTMESTDSDLAGDTADEDALLSYLASCYQILLFDDYANYEYNSVTLMSDLLSDDIYKGGSSASDQQVLYNMSQYDLNADLTATGLWTLYYAGLARCNETIIACETAEGVDDDDLLQYKAEAHFLRAYYVHWLWKFWGNIPYFEEALDEPYMAYQYTADEVYDELIEDLDYAIDDDKLVMQTTAANDGRATQAAAMMLKARVVMYQQDDSKYAEVLADMEEIINSGEFSLVDDFASIWLDTGEFGDGSIFESNHLGEGKEWSNAWTGYGTVLPAMISPNSLTGDDLLSDVTDYDAGWGFAPVRSEMVDIFEDDDERKGASINQFDDDDYTARFQNTGYFLAKYAAREDYIESTATASLNYNNNARIFRLAEAYLNAAELIVMDGQSPTSVTAQDCLDAIRTRAGLSSVTASSDNIKLERRREFFGEGMRFWDLVRWGDTDLLTESIDDYSSDRTWDDDKKYFPISQDEIDKTSGDYLLEQNPGY
jgi:tetratricopeptide (TPR) repeat protein